MRKLTSTTRVYKIRSDDLIEALHLEGDFVIEVEKIGFDDGHPVIYIHTRD